MSTVKPRRLMWIDFEATNLPVRNDFSSVHLLEVGVVVTDFNLNKLGGFSEVFKMTPKAAASIRTNPFVREMHSKNGLLQESIKTAQFGVAEIEQQIIDLLSEHGEQGEFRIAGSGVAQYDQPLLRYWMPTLETWLDYAPFDVGILRRGIMMLTGREIVTHTMASYGDEKLHRAMEDVLAHLEEAEKYREVLRKAFPQPEGEDTYINPSETTFQIGE